jgi:hypothetical protein
VVVITAYKISKSVTSGDAWWPFTVNLNLFVKSVNDLAYSLEFYQSWLTLYPVKIMVNEGVLSLSPLTLL